MGLGKTVMMIALIHCNRAWDSVVEMHPADQGRQQNTTEQLSPDDSGDERSENGDSDEEYLQPELIQEAPSQLSQTTPTKYAENSLIRAKTLVVVPLTLLSQWYDEIKQHSKLNSLSAHKVEIQYFLNQNLFIQYYGNARGGIDLSLYDVVITTYGVLTSEFSRTRGPAASKTRPLYNYEWYRIVLDESHYIKGRTICAAKACFELKGRNKWCLTGTPIQVSMITYFKN